MLRFLWDFSVRLWNKMDVDDILFLASGIAFNVLACLLPLLLFLIYALGIWFQSSETIGVVDRILATAFPNQPYAHNIRNAISSILAQIVASGQVLGLLSLAVLMATSASLFASLRSVLHRVFEVKASRHFVISYLVDLSLVLGLTLLILLLICLSWCYHMLRHLEHFVPSAVNYQFHGIYGTIPALVSPVLVAVFCCLLYRYVPAERIRWRIASLAAVTTTVIWETTGLLFAWYLGSLTSLGRVYGAYAFLIVLLVWVFYSSVIFIFGAEVGQVVRSRMESAKAK